MLPAELAASFAPLLFPDDDDAAEWAIVKAADKLTAYLKCLEELRAGNEDFRKAAQVLERDVRALTAAGGALLPRDLRAELLDDARRAQSIVAGV